MAKKLTDLFDDEESQSSDEFARLLDSSRSPDRRLSVGDRIRGEVLAVNGLEAFVSTGTPTDATMPFSGPAPKVGDYIDVQVLRIREGEILVKAAGSRGAGGDTESLEDAFDMELPVEGLVLEAVKGGFRVKVQNAKGFCPISQIDWHCSDPAAYVGKKYEFLITKMERGRDVVVSRRKLLELERASAEMEFSTSAEIGGIYSGQLFRLERFGAFVRLENGIEGLIPIGEISWNRIHSPQEVVSIGQTVQVKLLSVADDGQRLKIAFSLKQGGSVSDPWATLGEDYPVGTVLQGTVEHREPFGLFVNIASGVTGLLPRSSWRDSLEAQQFENKKKGDVVRVRVDRLDMTTRKLSFSLPREDGEENWIEHVKTAAPQKSFGSMADVLKGIKIK